MKIIFLYKDLVGSTPTGLPHCFSEPKSNWVIKRTAAFGLLLNGRKATPDSHLARLSFER